MNITIFILAFFLVLLILELFDHLWKIDEVHSRKRNEVAKLQDRIIQTLLEQRKEQN